MIRVTLTAGRRYTNGKLTKTYRQAIRHTTMGDVVFETGTDYDSDGEETYRTVSFEASDRGANSLFREFLLDDDNTKRN